jgi:hypothetical protein
MLSLRTPSPLVIRQSSRMLSNLDKAIQVPLNGYTVTPVDPKSSLIKSTYQDWDEAMSNLSLYWDSLINQGRSGATFQSTGGIRSDQGALFSYRTVIEDRRQLQLSLKRRSTWVNCNVVESSACARFPGHLGKA